MNEETPDTTNMSTAESRVRPEVVAPLREVASFVATLPLWQQHIAHSLLTEGAISEDESAVAFRLLLNDHGLLEAEPPKGSRLGEIAPGDGGGGETLVLQSIRPIDVNRIAPDQTLPFATNGLTVIYGENASGKSGYVRLLKAICGGPGSRSRLLPDVLSQTDAVVPAAEIRYRVGSDDVRIDWRAAEDPIDALAGICVFDSDAAPVFADSERVLEFLPAGLHVLGKLAETMTAFAARLDAEAVATRRSLPRVMVERQDTQAGRLVARLAEGQALPTSDQLTAAAKWAESEERRLQEATAKLALDPATSAARAERLSNSLVNMANRIRDLDDLLGEKALAELEELHLRATEARALAATTADSLSRQVSLLPGVGSDPWRQMFLNAREYALLAFGSRSLPPDAADPRCPLCQQPLDTDAASRLRHFSAYIESRAERIAVETETEITGRLEAITAVTVASSDDVQAIAAVVEPLLPAALPDLESAAATFDAATQRRQALRDGRRDGLRESFPWPVGVRDLLTAHAASLVAIAEENRQLADASTRDTIQREQDELVARRSLSQQSTAASQRLDLLVRLGAIAVARRACDTTTVSRKNSELRRAFVTAEYENRLRQEFSSLGLDQLPLRLTTRTQSGHSLVSVALESPWSLKNKDVLSDGEMRALALACFFAEAQRAQGGPPIVLDDPVSSLDHERVERVAQRVVAEARKGRQTIVFTHSLVFVHELWMRTSEARVPTTTHWLRSVRGVPGHVRASQRPWEAEDVRPRLGELERRLAAARRLDDHSTDEYRSAVAHFYTGLRETWERLVEELLLGRVVERYRLTVETSRLSVVDVTIDDYAKVYFAMSRASHFSGHDRPAARQLAPPTPDEMSQDLREIREYVKAVRTRHQRLERQRHARHAPPQGQLELEA